MKKLLFVCLGNICRSPAAEGITDKILSARGLHSKYQLDSAGTSAYHEGAPADGRMMAAANERGYSLTSRSRPVRMSDFDDFDYLLAMDENNFRDLQDLAKTDEHSKKVILITDYCKIHDRRGIPDPYYGAADGFNYVIDLLEDACGELISQLESH